MKKTKTIVGIVITLIIILIIFFIILAKPSDNKSRHIDRSLVVSILPLKSIVAKITGDDYKIEVLVPPGSSPETYEPTPKQLVSISDADLIFTVGLIDFEHRLMVKPTKQTGNKIVNLSDGVVLLSGCCGSAMDGGHSHHHHGVDPHIWTSPKQLKIMAANAYNAIALLHPDNKTYEANYRELLAELDELDVRIANMLGSAQVKCFFIYHPAMTYYANDYNIEQISIEQEGKEPSADQLRGLIDLARKDNIATILYQREFSKSVVETIAKDIGATPVEIDPLAENIVQSIIEITQHITANRE